MILRSRTVQPKDNAIRTKFAIFPIRMKKDEEDISGELIWLEKYLLTERYVQCVCHWHFKKSERVSQAFLDKLST